MEKELRIGNIIYWGKYKTKVFELTHDLDNDFSINCDKIDEFKPIPLTKEWLVNLGLNRSDADTPYNFEISSLEYLWIKDQGLKVFYTNGKHSEDMPLATYPCDYVHQLQNIYYSLTGEELTLKETT